MIDLTPAQSELLAWLAGRRGYASPGQMATALKITRDAAYKRAEELYELGAVERKERIVYEVSGRRSVGYREKRRRR